jgi:hypothetical protein
MPKSKDEDLIFADDWFVDGDGKNWAVEAIDVEKKEVRLRLLDKPTRTESLDDLRANYKLGGFRAHMMKLKALGEKK